MGLMGAKFGGPWSDIDVNQNKIGATRRFLPKRRPKAHVKRLKAVENETEFSTCATCKQIVLVACLRKREITQMEIKGLPESVEIPKGSQGEAEEGR